MAAGPLVFIAYLVADAQVDFRIRPRARPQPQLLSDQAADCDAPDLPSDIPTGPVDWKGDPMIINPGEIGASLTAGFFTRIRNVGNFPGNVSSVQGTGCLSTFLRKPLVSIRQALLIIWYSP